MLERKRLLQLSGITLNILKNWDQWKGINQLTKEVNIHLRESKSWNQDIKIGTFDTHEALNELIRQGYASKCKVLRESVLGLYPLGIG